MSKLGQTDGTDDKEQRRRMRMAKLHHIAHGVFGSSLAAAPVLAAGFVTTNALFVGIALSAGAANAAVSGTMTATFAFAGALCAAAVSTAGAAGAALVTEKYKDDVPAQNAKNSRTLGTALTAAFGLAAALCAGAAAYNALDAQNEALSASPPAAASSEEGKNARYTITGRNCYRQKLHV